jgi:hypothetical protein
MELSAENLAGIEALWNRGKTDGLRILAGDRGLLFASAAGDIDSEHDEACTQFSGGNEVPDNGSNPRTQEESV